MTRMIRYSGGSTIYFQLNYQVIPVFTVVGSEIPSYTLDKDALQYNPQLGSGSHLVLEAIKTNRWYLFETRVKFNDAGIQNGALSWWVDGVLIADYFNLWLGGPSSVNKIMVHGYLSGTSCNICEMTEAKHQWTEQFVLSTNPIGPTGGIIDTTPPSRPTGLTVD